MNTRNATLDANQEPDPEKLKEFYGRHNFQNAIRLIEITTSTTEPVQLDINSGESIMTPLKWLENRAEKFATLSPAGRADIDSASRKIISSLQKRGFGKSSIYDVNTRTEKETVEH